MLRYWLVGASERCGPRSPAPVFHDSIRPRSRAPPAVSVSSRPPRSSPTAGILTSASASFSWHVLASRVPSSYLASSVSNGKSSVSIVVTMASSFFKASSNARLPALAGVALTRVLRSTRHNRKLGQTRRRVQRGLVEPNLPTANSQSPLAFCPGKISNDGVRALSFPMNVAARAGSLSLLGVLLSSFNVSGQTPVVTQTNVTVRVMAANLTSGTGQSYEAAGIRIFQGLKPDIVAIQEFKYNSSTSDTQLRQLVDTAFGTSFYYYRETNGPATTFPTASSAASLSSAAAPGRTWTPA